MIRIFTTSSRNQKLVMCTAALSGTAAALLVHDQRTVALAFLAAIGVAALDFITAYGLRSNWRATIVGRAMFWLAAAFFVLVCWIMLALFVPHFPGRDLVRSLLYLFFALMFLQMDITLYRVQRAERKGEPLEDLSALDNPRGES